MNLTPLYRSFRRAERNLVSPHQLLAILIYAYMNQNIIFVYGSGKRKTVLQRTMETLDSYISRLKDYTKKLHICGDRNSFSKTDYEATFMRMKEDAMKNGQLKPAYNLQYGVEASFIVWAGVYPNPTDTRTLIPFLEDFHAHIGKRSRNLVADAGYESEENYLYLREKGQASYIKPNNYEVSKKSKWKQDIGRRENMNYLSAEDVYQCAEGRRLVVTGTRRTKSASGYVSEKTIYTCTDCNGCERKKQCIHGNHSKIPMEERTKRLEVAKVFQRERAKNLARIKSTEGIVLRMNRSIQAEGVFAQIKGAFGFRRFLTRGRANVLGETILLALAHNVFKLHQKIQSGTLERHLVSLREAA